MTFEVTYGQLPHINAPFRIDELYASLTASDTTTVKPVGMRVSDGKLFYVPSWVGGGSSQWISGSGFIYNTGKVSVGGDVSPTYQFEVKTNTNGLGGMSSYNINAGSSAFAHYILGNDANASAAGMFLSSNANAGYSGAGGMDFGTIINEPLSFITNNTYRGQFTASGLFSLEGAIKIKGGSPGSGKVLTSDADGDATWETPSSGGSSQWVTSGSNIYYSTGAVGIGASTTPNRAMHVFTNTNGLAGAQLSNINAGSSAYTILQFENDASATAGGVFATSSTNSGYGGVGSMNLGTFGSGAVAIFTNNTVAALFNASTQAVRLPALGGSGAGYVAVDNSGNLSWSAGSGGGGFTSPLTTTGDLLSYSGGTHVRIGAGTSGYYLGANGAGTLPSWKPFPSNPGDVDVQKFTAGNTGAGSGSFAGSMAIFDGEAGYFVVHLTIATSDNSTSYVRETRVPFKKVSGTFSLGTEHEIWVSGMGAYPHTSTYALVNVANNLGMTYSTNGGNLAWTAVVYKYVSSYGL